MNWRYDVPSAGRLPDDTTAIALNPAVYQPSNWGGMYLPPSLGFSWFIDAPAPPLNVLHRRANTGRVGASGRFTSVIPEKGNLRACAF